MNPWGHTYPNFIASSSELFFFTYCIFKFFKVLLTFSICFYFVWILFLQSEIFFFLFHCEHTFLYILEYSYSCFFIGSWPANSNTWIIYGLVVIISYCDFFSFENRVQFPSLLYVEQFWIYLCCSFLLNFEAPCYLSVVYSLNSTYK